MSESSVTESRDINAPASEIFSILCDPALQPAIDGTGMLRSAVDNQVINQVGDVFYIEMTHWDRGDYVMENLVVEFEQDRRVAWEPVAQTSENPKFASDPQHPEPRRWGWQLEPLSEDRTRVTEFFDGSRLSKGLRDFIKNGEFWRSAMVTSLENLERIVNQPGRESGDSPNSETAQQFVELYRENDL